eukprot:gene8545-10142_t
MASSRNAVLFGAALGGFCSYEAMFSTRPLDREVPATTSGSATPSRYDYILCGSGPGAAAWLRSTLHEAPTARILMLERGPYCKTDVLTEGNLVRLYLDSNRMIANYSHGVKQGCTLGGGTAINNYAWITPSYSDLKNALGMENDAHSQAIVGGFQEMCESLLGPRQPPHLLHQLLTASLPRDVGLITNSKILVQETNRNKVFLGAPTLNGAGERRSAFAGLIEPLWREHFRNLHIVTDQTVARVVFHEENQGDGSALPRVKGVQTADGSVFHTDTVVLACGALETPAVLMRSGIGAARHLRERGVPVLVDNPHVGQHLKDKMLLDDMILTDNTTGSFDESLLIVNRIFKDGASVQLHRYDKATVGNSYLALTRLLRGAWQDLVPSGGLSLLTAVHHATRYLSPRGYSAFCFQTYIKMQSEASITLADDVDRTASLDASKLFQELVDCEKELKARVMEVYKEIPEMRDAERIQYQTTVPAITSGAVSPHFRLVWHFAGTCRVGDVVDPHDFSVMGTKGLHVADMSVCRVTSDGGAMAMAYLTGHVVAAQMLQAKLLREQGEIKSTKEAQLRTGRLVYA